MSGDLFEALWVYATFGCWHERTDDFVWKWDWKLNVCDDFLHLKMAMIYSDRFAFVYFGLSWVIADFWLRPWNSSCNTLLHKFSDLFDL